MNRGASGVEGAVFTADQAWVGRWAGPSAMRVDGGRLRWIGPRTTAGRDVAAHIPGVLLPGLTDHHVHLGLTDPAALSQGGLARVLDLGWEPRQAARWRALGEGALTGHDLGTDLDGDDVRPACDVEVEFAGAFLTAVGGYPVMRAWAPRHAVRQVATAQEAVDAVAEMLWFGASLIKVVLNADAGPVLSDALLAVVLDQAHAAGVPVVAHAEGAGQAVRAVAAGVDLLAHTPWTERLADADIRAAADRCTWISTLDIHGRGAGSPAHDVAVDNLRRFTAAGGRVRYGTDLGNGDLPVGVNERELRCLVDAGLDAAQLLDAIAPTRHDDEGPRCPGPDLGPRVTWLPAPAPQDHTTPGELVTLLARAAAVAVTDLEETFA